MVKEQIDNLLPDFSSADIFNDDDVSDLQEVFLGHDQPHAALNLPKESVHEDRIILFPIPRGCGDMKVILMAN
jgi:hypothetical protein